MSSRERTRDRGLQHGLALRAGLAAELHQARLGAGVSQAHIARVAGLTQSRVSRTERNVRNALTIEEAATHAAALGLQLYLKAYPASSAVRDAPQLRVLERLRAHVGPGFRWRTEVPVVGRGDLRAWDAFLDGPGNVGVEAESRLHDVQATQRRVQLKLRDGDASVVILLLAETRHNRRVLTEHRAALVSTFPWTTAQILGALRRGEVPAQSGIVVLEGLRPLGVTPTLCARR